MVNAAQKAAATKAQPKPPAATGEVAETPVALVAPKPKAKREKKPLSESAQAKKAARAKVDISALVAGATTTEKPLPRITHSGAGGRGGSNPFAEKIREAYEAGKRLELPAVPNREIADALVPVIRRGAISLNLKIKIRFVDTDAGVVVVIEAHKGDTDAK